MKITIGSDHAGLEYKSKIINILEDKGYEVLDAGTHTKEKVDYPDYAHLVAKEVLVGSDLGVLICGSGNGVSMAANKHKGIRAAVCWNKEISKLARNHNDANIICLPARFLTHKELTEIIEVFLLENFDQGRHTKRVNKI